jgi:RimJ/RimL family protein N-acetyltransferase
MATQAGAAGPCADGFDFRPLADLDLPLLSAWLARPHVAEWWAPGEPRPTVAELHEDFLSPEALASSVRPHIAWLAGEPVAFIQSYRAMGSGEGWWEEVTDPGVFGIDQFLADGQRLNQGLGTRLVRAFVASLFARPEVTLVQTDPDPRNARAIRCYQKAGFVAQREILTPDGPALLMQARRSAPPLPGRHRR